MPINMISEVEVAEKGSPAASLEALARDFDLFLVDQFGVLHDGIAPYPGAIDGLRHLAAAGKKTIMLTNSGKRSAPNLARVQSLGFPPEALHAVVSSGEVAWRAIESGSLGAPFVRGARAFIIGRPGETYGFEEVLTPVAEPAGADFLLIAQSDAPAMSPAAYADLLREAGAAAVPALCINPDMTMLHETGLQPGSGAIAALYWSLGGPVTYLGKPYGPIYETARAMAPGTGARRTLVVGDSIEHDIRGGADAGLATALVRTGILADLPASELEALYTRFGVRPDYVLASFRWT